MIKVAVYDNKGQEKETLEIARDVLGRYVRYPLLKQAVVMYHANKRVGTASTKGRGEVAGSGKKLFRQKGTGLARAGTSRTGKRVGGGTTFAKKPRDFRQSMPRKQRHLAVKSSVLAKLLNEDVVVVDKLDFEEPKTKKFAGILNNLNIDRSCVVVTNDTDKKLYKSARNIPKIQMMRVAELNAGDICNHRKLLFTKEAFDKFVEASKQQTRNKKVS
jgi:large subunit ribosomal protein L4